MFHSERYEIDYFVFFLLLPNVTQWLAGTQIGLKLVSQVPKLTLGRWTFPMAIETTSFAPSLSAHNLSKHRSTIAHKRMFCQQNPKVKYSIGGHSQFERSPKKIKNKDNV